MPKKRVKFDSYRYVGHVSARQWFKSQDGYDTEQGERRGVLAYKMSTGACNDRNQHGFLPLPTPDTPNSTLGDIWNSGLPSFGKPARNTAYSIFRFYVGQGNTGLGETLAEYRESFNLISRSLLSIAESWRNLKGGKGLKDAIRALTVTDLINHREIIRGKRRGRRSPVYRKSKSRQTNLKQSAASAWLSFSFGIAPTIGSIQSSMETTSSNPFKSGTARGVGRAVLTNQIIGEYSSRDMLIRDYASASYKIVMKADYKVVNPNTYLLQALGLANPLSIAYELIPFSFMLDYVSSCGLYLESWSDFLGLEFSDAHTSCKMDYNYTNRWDWFSPPAGSSFVVKGSHFERFPAILGPVVDFDRQYVGQSLTRAANLAALLVTTLKGS